MSLHMLRTHLPPPPLAHITVTDYRWHREDMSIPTLLALFLRTPTEASRGRKVWFGYDSIPFISFIFCSVGTYMCVGERAYSRARVFVRC